MKAPGWFVKDKRLGKKIQDKVFGMVKGATSENHGDIQEKANLLIGLSKAMSDLRWARFRVEEDIEGNTDFSRADQLHYNEGTDEIEIAKEGEPHKCGDHEEGEEGEGSSGLTIEELLGK